MNLAIVHTRACVGIAAPPVSVEVQLTNGLPSFSIVGLPEAAVRESKDRVRGALLSSGYDYPARRITVNLAPADLPKEGGRFDLPIALGMLAASGQVPVSGLDGIEFVGELALSGLLRPVRGALCAALEAARAHRVLVVPRENLDEAACVRDATVRGAASLLEVGRHLASGGALDEPVPGAHGVDVGDLPDLRDVRGQHQARRALEIAAAGAHNLLLIGPPGCGKTMLCSRLNGLLPPLSEDAAIEVAAVASASAQAWSSREWGQRPFRTPHHSASAVALVGGGSRPRPGEVTLAHRGVLFLDELPEFDRRVLEMLREPLESGAITVSRAAGSETFPADFQLLAAMNPCPCGYLGDVRCHCSAEKVARYRSRLSGPLLDRIDMHVELPPLQASELFTAVREGEPSAAVAVRVQVARDIQMRRAGRLNSRLEAARLGADGELPPAVRDLLSGAMRRLGLSARSLHRVLRVARSVADLAGSDGIEAEHVAEAIGYRRLDRGVEVASP